MSPLRAPLVGERRGQRGKIHPVTLPAVENGIDDVRGQQRHAQDPGQIAQADLFLLGEVGQVSRHIRLFKGNIKTGRE